ncbi:hypothetical protein F5X99DRAFT_338581 [Biscogniauxia marginata]|nr:hypothetical protein F5X99DRAFT_338581 [Biscogniauxia marginata]
MFEIPDAKRVRRKDLYGSASDEEDIHDDQLASVLQEKLHQQLSGLLNLSFVADEPSQKDQASYAPPSGAGDEGPEVEGTGQTGEETFAFRLFRDEEPSHTVVLPRDDELIRPGDGGFVVPKRPISYYFANSPPPETARRFRQAAVSADYLLEDAKRKRWGLEKPWKVTSITITARKGGHDQNSESQMREDTAGKRKRPGKKRRIILRIREKAKQEREEEAKRKLVEKGQHLMDKKKRLNREKKLKRRAKAREAKQAGGGDRASAKSSRESSPEDK